MKLRIACLIVGFISLVQFTIAQISTPGASALPRLVRFAGTVKDLNGNPLTGIVGITFAFYSEKTGGAPLWIESQNATADSTGQYTALLGSTKPEGLPAELFTSEQARWVGAQVAGQAEQPRVLLVSAPYALKAGDAETIGGLPASAFVRAMTEVSTSGNGSGGQTAKDGKTGGSAGMVNGSGKAAPATETQNYVAKFANATGGLGNSLIFDNGANVGVATNAPAY